MHQDFYNNMHAVSNTVNMWHFSYMKWRLIFFFWWNKNRNVLVFNRKCILSELFLALPPHIYIFTLMYVHWHLWLFIINIWNCDAKHEGQNEDIKNDIWTFRWFSQMLMKNLIMPLICLCPVCLLRCSSLHGLWCNIEINFFLWSEILFLYLFH